MHRYESLKGRSDSPEFYLNYFYNIIFAVYFAIAI